MKFSGGDSAVTALCRPEYWYVSIIDLIAGDEDNPGIPNLRPGSPGVSQFSVRNQPRGTNLPRNQRDLISFFPEREKSISTMSDPSRAESGPIQRLAVLGGDIVFRLTSRRTTFDVIKTLGFIQCSQRNQYGDTIGFTSVIQPPDKRNVGPEMRYGDLRNHI